MKRSLSLFLSLVLLVSALVVPMTALAEGTNFGKDDLNAAGAQNGYPCTLEKFNNKDVGNRYTYNNNLLKDRTPELYLAGKTVARTKVENSYNTNTYFPRLTDGTLGTNSDIIITGQTFVSDGVTDGSGNLTDFANGYVPTEEFTFDNITTYADIVYDLGGYFSISQIQHFTAGNNYSYNRTGIYQIYAAKTKDELFKSESLLINYQITSDDITSSLASQDFNFTDNNNQPTARYFAYRVLCPVAAISSSTLAKDIRITELAVCGTPNNKIFDVTVNKVLYDNIAIKYADGSQCELVKAEEGKNVKFTLNQETIPAGVDVTVKYGDVKIEPVGDVYTITVEKDKVLHIIPSHKVTEGTKDNINITDQNNVSKSITPRLYVTKGDSRWDRTASQAANLATLSDGTTNASDVGITDGNGAAIIFNNGSFYNKYSPGVEFEFNKASYDAYADLVFDLGRPTDIYKFQHIAISPSNSMGVYQLYASESATNLFSKESLICNYQNMNESSKISQEIEFPIRTAQYVAVRCYMPIMSGITGYGNCFRIKELAIYGTPSNTVDYKVTEIQAPTGGVDAPTDVPNKESDLLNADTFESVKSYEGGKLVKTVEKLNSSYTQYLNKLNSQTYYSYGHGDFNLDVKFYSGGKCKNGYSIDRTNTNGNIVFYVPAKDPTVYYDFTYDLGDYYKINKFGAYLYLTSNDQRRVQAYEVYIGNDRDTLYTDEPVAVYNNYYNTYGQMITFDKAKVGKYIGFRVLNPSTSTDDGNTYVRLDELAAYGTKVGAPDADSQLAPAKLTSNTAYIYNKDGSSVYPDTNESQRTALRLTVGYKSPKVPGGANASKIILANGNPAKVIERNVIAIAKSKYDQLTDEEKNNLNIHTNSTGLRVSTATGDAVNNYFKSEYVTDDKGNIIEADQYRMAYGALNLNNISEDNSEKQIVVRGRVVYEYNGEIYAVYSDIVGVKETVSAQSAYENLCDNIAKANENSYAKSPLWFNNTKWNGEDFITQTSAQ